MPLPQAHVFTHASRRSIYLFLASGTGRDGCCTDSAALSQRVKKGCATVPISHSRPRIRTRFRISIRIKFRIIWPGRSGLEAFSSSCKQLLALQDLS